ncbi:Gti1/Pac2 family-domain-containing protein [Mycena leptocephala]|nr:Gti1/Pac2 family-domain-containing protein [Mycena leptocephala]
MSSSRPISFYGAVETTMNALRLVYAAHLGIIPRMTRRLSDFERGTMIESGAVFVYSVEESGITRWTDGLLWSPSRIFGNFLIYREINELTDTPECTHRNHRLQTGQHIFKPNGLIKKTITVAIEGSDFHLIWYYTAADQRSGKLKGPTSCPDIMSLSMEPCLFRATTFRVPPKADIAADGSYQLV